MVAILVTPPGEEPVTREEAKAHARVDGTDEDSRIDALIAAARADVENRTGRALITQGWRIVRDGVPRGGILRLAPAPVQSVAAVTVYGEDGAPCVVPADDYEVDVASAPGRLRLLPGRQWGVRSMNGLEVDISCGYGGPQAVPAPLKQAILMLVAYWFEVREAAAYGAVGGPVASRTAALLAPYRVTRL
jgi:uncharacterized phiE125 gp8 family phage protein